MRLVGYPQVNNAKGLDDLRKHVSNFFDLLIPIINGNIEFGSNIRSAFGAATITVAGEVVAIPHNLPFIPQGFLVMHQDSGAVVYAANAGAYPWTTSNIYLTASSAVTAKVIIL